MTRPKELPPRFCPVCDEPVTGRANKKYCTPECRIEAERRDPVARKRKSQTNRAWRESNRDRMRELVSTWRRENRDLYREQMRRANLKVKLSPQKRLEKSVRRAVSQSIARGSKWGRSTFSLLGYSADDLRRHLEKKFGKGMSWENYGEWHIDHTIPLSAFNYETPDDYDFRRAWALKNLKPMWSLENVKKGARLDKPFQPTLAFGRKSEA